MLKTMLHDLSLEVFLCFCVHDYKRILLTVPHTVSGS